MGSKSHDLYSLQVAPVCNQDIDLFKKNLVQFSAYSKKGIDIFKGLLKNSQRPINLKIFEKLGFTSEIIMTQEMLTDEAVFNFIKNQVDNTVTEITDWFFFPFNYLNVIEQLKNDKKLTLDYTDTETFTFIANGKTETIDLPSVKYNDKTYYVMKRKIENDGSEIPAISSEVLEGNINETVYYIRLSEEKNAFHVEDGATHEYPEKIEYLPDERTTLRVKYLNNENKECVWEGLNNIIREATITKILGVVVKNNGVLQQEDKKTHVALSNLGIKYEDVKSSLHNDALKTFFITYATKNKNYHFFSRYLNNMYQINNNITINVENNIFKYHYISYMDNGQISSNYVLSINTSDGENVRYKQNDNEFFYFIPLNWIKELNVKERYQFIEECLSVVAYSHDVVKTKWYESGFFQFVVLVIAAIASDNPGLVIGMNIAEEIIASSNLSPELKIALFIAMSITVSHYNNPDANVLNVENVVNISAELGKYYFKSETQDVADSIQRIEEQRKNTAKIINNIKKQTIYMPMEQIDQYYDLQYELLYNFNDLYYNTINEPIINDKNLI